MRGRRGLRGLGWTEGTGRTEGPEGAEGWGTLPQRTGFRDKHFSLGLGVQGLVRNIQKCGFRVKVVRVKI